MAPRKPHRRRRRRRRPPRSERAPETSRISSRARAAALPSSSRRPRTTSPSHRPTSPSPSCSTSPASTEPASPRRPSSTAWSEASTSRRCTCRPRTGPTLRRSWKPSRRFWRRRRRDAKPRGRSRDPRKRVKRNFSGTGPYTSSASPWAGSSPSGWRCAGRIWWTGSSSSTRRRRSTGRRGRPSGRCSRRFRRRSTEACLTRWRRCSSNPPRSSPAASTPWPGRPRRRGSRWTARSGCRSPTWERSCPTASAAAQPRLAIPSRRSPKRWVRSFRRSEH
mmetsp:Transcript_9625/g.37574  ORF Transcript_9625/g.37574 Transcript_9625/m.37574 type:complete len:278 (-) Transcript_9625:1568-2401(-)